ncbi:MAG: hypothetical protein P1P87_04470 [Trueperaceae bacterium]|nr:hypothetical protein [Trueperaceae bacterium]
MLARRLDADVVRRLEARWGARLTVGWREDGDGPTAVVDVDALAARIEAVAAPRVAVWIGADGVEVVPVA